MGYKRSLQILQTEPEAHEPGILQRDSARQPANRSFAEGSVSGRVAGLSQLWINAARSRMSKMGVAVHEFPPKTMSCAHPFVVTPNRIVTVLSKRTRSTSSHAYHDDTGESATDPTSNFRNPCFKQLQHDLDVEGSRGRQTTDFAELQVVLRTPHFESTQQRKGSSRSRWHKNTEPGRR